MQNGHATTEAPAGAPSEPDEGEIEGLTFVEVDPTGRYGRVSVSATPGVKLHLDRSLL